MRLSRIRILFLLCMSLLGSIDYLPAQFPWTMDYVSTPSIWSVTCSFTDNCTVLGMVYFNKGFKISNTKTVAMNVYPDQYGPVNLGGGTWDWTNHMSYFLGNTTTTLIRDTGVIYATNTTIDLWQSMTITNTIYFVGANTINGNGAIFNVNPSGHFVLEHGASLALNNLTLRGITGGNTWGSIVCTDNTATLSLNNVVWEQSANYSFTQGQFYVAGAWDLEGTATFNYATTKTSTIASFASMLIDKNFTFNYMPTSANRNLLYMQDSSSNFELYGGTLASTTTGIQLTQGTFLCTEKGCLFNPGAVAQSQGITFGNGSYANDLTVCIDGTLQVLTGNLVYDNKEQP